MQGDFLAGDDADLPPELAPLAGRLSRDADRLAARYPATVLRKAHTGARGLSLGGAARISGRRGWRLAWGALAAALLLAAGIGLAGRWNGTSAPEDEQPLAARERPVVQPMAMPAATIVRPRPSATRAPRFLPASSFHNLSAPQQEAVLDLLDEGGQELTRLSI